MLIAKDKQSVKGENVALSITSTKTICFNNFDVGLAKSDKAGANDSIIS